MSIIMPFGKYKGIKVENIPNDYIAWLLRCDIVKGDLKLKIEDCIKEKYKDVWLSKALEKWVSDNYSAKSYSSNYSELDFVSGSLSDLYDAMDGCLPNQ